MLINQSKRLINLQKKSDNLKLRKIDIHEKYGTFNNNSNIEKVEEKPSENVNKPVENPA